MSKKHDDIKISQLVAHRLSFDREPMNQFKSGSIDPSFFPQWKWTYCEHIGSVLEPVVYILLLRLPQNHLISKSSY